MIGTSSFQILFPAPYSIKFSRLQQQLEEAHFAWKTEWKRQQLDFKIENIRFVHDPLWNRRVFSLQSARDGGQLVLAGDPLARYVRGVFGLN